MNLQKEKMKLLYIYISTSFILIVIIIYGLFYPSYKEILKNNIELEKIKNEKFADENIITLRENIDYSKNFILFLSNLKTIKNYEKNNTSEKEVTLLLLNAIEHFDFYHQIRLLDKNGKEKIRVEKNKNIISVFSKKNLQDKSHRYYYKAMKKLPPHTIWTSNLDANIEHKKIEIPLNPTIRLGLKLLNNEFLVINISLQNEFKKISESSFLDDENVLYIETNSNVWIIKNELINYIPQYKSKNFYMKGLFIKKNNIEELKKEVLFNEIFKNSNRLLLIIFSIFFIGYILKIFWHKKTLLAYNDSLTSCYNRNFFENEIDKIDKINFYTLCFIDVNNLKQINDNFGHIQGDKLIIAVSKILRAYFHKDTFIIRLGGDEFLILSKLNELHLKTILNKIQNKLYRQKINNIPISISFGISSTDNFYVSLKLAEEKMYQMKKNFKNL